MRKCSGNLFCVRREPRIERFARRSLVVGFLAFSIGIVTLELKASSTGQEEITGQLRTADALHERGDYSHSVPILKGIVQRYPQNYRANLLLGEDLLFNGKPQ